MGEVHTAFTPTEENLQGICSKVAAGKYAEALNLDPAELRAMDSETRRGAIKKGLNSRIFPIKRIIDNSGHPLNEIASRAQQSLIEARDNCQRGTYVSSSQPSLSDLRHPRTNASSSRITEDTLFNKAHPALEAFLEKYDSTSNCQVQSWENANDIALKKIFDIFSGSGFSVDRAVDGLKAFTTALESTNNTTFHPRERMKDFVRRFIVSEASQARYEGAIKLATAINLPDSETIDKLAEGFLEIENGEHATLPNPPDLVQQALHEAVRIATVPANVHTAIRKILVLSKLWNGVDPQAAMGTLEARQRQDAISSFRSEHPENPQAAQEALSKLGIKN